MTSVGADDATEVELLEGIAQYPHSIRGMIRFVLAFWLVGAVVSVVALIAIAASA